MGPTIALIFPLMRYLMYYWPIITAAFIICFNFVIMTIISYLSWNQIWSFFFKEDAGVMEDDPLIELEDERDIVSFKISERAEKQQAVRKKENREGRYSISLFVYNFIYL